MNISELVQAAQKAVGSNEPIAEGMGVHINRLSDWKAGRRRPEASEIAYLAEIAGYPVLETVAEIESQLSGKHSNVWLKALEDWRARRDSNPRPLPSEGSTLSS